MNLNVQIECAKNELSRRKESFPRLVDQGRMRQDYADLEIAKMRAVYQTLSQLKGIAGQR